jgi:hypothetical protein
MGVSRRPAIALFWVPRQIEDGREELQDHGSKRKNEICSHIAIANAENNEGVSADELYVSQAVVEEGPKFKKWLPRARGMASPIRKRLSHIKIVLTDEKPNGK